jgi:hypothetical protein
MFTPLRLVPALCGLLAALMTFADARQMTKEQLRQRQIEAAARFEFRRPNQQDRPAPGVKNITFTNPEASRNASPLHS